ncbi:hypothetical protein Salat_2400300 [Sesamum alatum]|uniref:Uncharacterized protein n=1 Tax=Sesamum alatum TaxID=300844 RepID=A0AAE1XXM7_9LAMI|nr:hypothetical protein Salat_2400300 [Sesamum alatum]
MVGFPVGWQQCTCVWTLTLVKVSGGDIGFVRLLCDPGKVPMDKEIPKISFDLKLSEDEGSEVSIPKDIWKQGSSTGQLVVGKVLSDRTYHFEALKTILFRILNPGR